MNAAIVDPIGCTVLFIGTKKVGGKSVYYEYDYPGGMAPNAEFGNVTFPTGWTGLSDVLILASTQPSLPLDALLDDVCLTTQG